MPFYVYMLECADGAYYVGSYRGEDLTYRVHEHNLGKYPNAYTHRRRPVTLIWSEAFADPSDMVAAERRLKGWSRAKKEAYIRGDLAALKAASVSKSAPADPKKKAGD
ncbi:MAG: GIY-YIG nuclease family protein [Pseudomonadota bacterium]